VPDFAAGQIVLADWRDGLPKEPNKLRPAVVVQDTDLFDLNHPNVILVPLSEDRFAVMANLSVVIEPTPENGCSKRCYALSPSVTATSVRRVRATESRVLPAQLAEIRRQIGYAIGLE
jgi:mRNA interferase MazF